MIRGKEGALLLRASIQPPHLIKQEQVAMTRYTLSLVTLLLLSSTAYSQQQSQTTTYYYVVEWVGGGWFNSATETLGRYQFQP
jgi:hypothetical protein